jgi:ethanolamine ammonia-lyase small subunit
MAMQDALAANLRSRLLRSTPARIGVTRAGTRPDSDALLAFRWDHAQAKDAVHHELSQHFLSTFAASGNYPIVQSLASDRRDYILNPPRGKKTAEQTIQNLVERCRSNCDVQIVISDGLSARAVETNAPDVTAMIEQGLELENISSGTPVIVRFGRVAIADQIAYALKARLVINLIGERPGLSSSDSMSAYMTYNPGPHTISSDRTVVSNIHARGTPPTEAGAHIVKLAKMILTKQLSGVRLQQLL